MNEEINSAIYRSKQSLSYGNYIECKKIQDSYWERFIGDFSRLIDLNNKEYEEEQKTIDKLQVLIESDLFPHLLENDKYYEKVNALIMEDSLMVGKSQTKLLNIYHKLEELCSYYKIEYESFVEETRKRMKADYYKVEDKTKIVYEKIFNTNICTESFFNALCNNGIV